MVRAGASAAPAALVTGPGAIAETEHRLSTLPSGVRVITESMPAVRSVAVGCLIGAGSAAEPRNQAGISHLLEHMLFRGTERYSSQEVDQIFDAMGSELDAQTDRETTALCTRILDRHLERALDVIGEMLWRPRFAELQAEREVVLEEIAMYEDDPQERIFDVLGEAIFGDHPLGRPVIGSAATVSSITAQDLRSFHAQHYLPANMVIAAAGSIEHEQLVDLVQKLAPEPQLGSQPSTGVRASASRAAARAGNTPHPAERASAPAGKLAADGLSVRRGSYANQDRPAPSGKQLRFVQKDTEQYHLCIGGRGIAREDERRFALRVMDTVLGAGPSSRMFQEVRERRGLAYAVFSFSGLYEQTGEIGLYVGTRPENLAAALATIAAELRRFVEDPADAGELARAKESVKGRMALTMESTGARMARLGGSIMHEMPLLTLEQAMDRVDAVTVDDLRQLARELLDPQRLSVAAIGPDEDRLREAVRCLEAVAA
jgi:predicted Zn-dependent peptidase